VGWSVNGMRVRDAASTTTETNDAQRAAGKCARGGSEIKEAGRMPEREEKEREEKKAKLYISNRGKVQGARGSER
jgi:hypothetical protein